MNKKLALLAFAAIVLLVYPVKAATESVYVDLYFNIASVDELTVTLLGQSAVTSLPASQATPANIEFNVSSNTYWQNATVTGGGSTQDDTNPILALDNTGTSNLEINISLNSTLPASTCTMVLRYINDSSPYDISALTAESNGIAVSTTNVTINSSYTPAGAALGLWLYGNFSDCADSDDTVRRFTIYATTA